MCTQNYPNSQFVSGNGPRYQVCVRCATENDMLAEGEETALYSDELVRARSALFARRFRPGVFFLQDGYYSSHLERELNCGQIFWEL